MAAPKTPYREKLVAIVSRRECVYKRAGELSVTFHERGGARKRADDDFGLPQKRLFCGEKEEQWSR